MYSTHNYHVVITQTAWASVISQKDSGFVPALACFTTGLLSFYWRTYPLTYFAVKFPSSCYR